MIPSSSPSLPPATPLPVGVLAEIALDPGVAPLGLVATPGSLWVTTHRGTTLYRIDTSTNRVAERIDVGGNACGYPALAFSRIWVGGCDGTMAAAIDTRSGSVLPVDAMAALFGPTSTGIFASQPAQNATHSVRVNLTSLAVTTVQAPAAAAYLEAGGSVWATQFETANLVEIDPSTGKLMATFNLGSAFPNNDAIYPIALGGAIWIVGFKSPDLVRFDLATHQIADYQIPNFSMVSGYFDVRPVAALGSLWLRISDSAVARIDPATAKVVATYPAGPGGGDVAIDEGSLWVANFSTDTIWRERLTP